MPRAHGGRGRGRSSTRDPRAMFEARKTELMVKAQELKDVDREDVAVAMVCTSIDGLGGVDYWPSMEEAREVVELLFELPEEERITEDHANYVTGLREAQMSELAKVREGSIAAVLGPWDLDGKPEEELRGLLASIEVSRKAARSRIRERLPQPDESVAENVVAGEEDASGEVQGTQKQPQPQPQPQGVDEVQGTQNHPPGEDDDDDAAWMEQLVEDLKEKPESASGSAAPHEYIDVGEEDASGEVQGTQKQPQGADEVQGTQNQPPGDAEDDDDAAWMEQLVEDLKDKPESASGSAAPHLPAPHEYIDVGGYLMESDAFDYIQYDLRMFTPYYGEPLRLWPWDDSSFPWGASLSWGAPPPK